MTFVQAPVTFVRGGHIAGGKFGAPSGKRWRWTARRPSFRARLPALRMVNGGESGANTGGAAVQSGAGRSGQSQAVMEQRRVAYVEADGDDIEPPAGFVAPEPKLFQVPQGGMLDFATGALGSLLRAGSGAFVTGYRVRMRDDAERSGTAGATSTAAAGTTATTTATEPPHSKDWGAQVQERVYSRIEESSAFLPSSRPAPGTIKLYEFEACPFCRKVREAASALDLDVLMFPCPKGGERYRPYVQERGGKQMFPYLIDENTGFEGYESDEIIRYLCQTYGDGRVPLPLSLGPLTTFSAGLASLTRRGHGARKAGTCAVPKYPLELWAYEASPFSKVVRERLVELELPYLLHNCARGSVNRRVLQNLTGRVQVPYLMDPNTGIAMFESADIVEYLNKTYGPESANARKRQSRRPSTASTSGSSGGSGAGAVPVPTTRPSPASGTAGETAGRDDKLEAYCSDPANAAADECRVYDD